MGGADLREPEDLAYSEGFSSGAQVTVGNPTSVAEWCAHSIPALSDSFACVSFLGAADDAL